jgi:hypothetical protein
MEMLLLGIACFLMGGISFTFWLHRSIEFWHCCKESQKYACGLKPERRHGDRRKIN